MKHSPQPSGHSGAARRWLFYAPWLIAVCGSIAYSNSFFGDWVLDDTLFIKSNTYIRDLSKPWLLLDGPGRTRPVGFFTFALNYAFGQTQIEGYHAVNLLIHLATGIMAFLTVRLLLGAPSLQDRFNASRDGVALSIALIFTVHPLETQAVTYVYQRVESLASLFYLLTVYCFFVGRSQRSPTTLTLCVVFSLLGMLTKEVVFTAPVAVYLLDAVLFQRSFWRPLRTDYAIYAALFATMCVPFAMTIIHREYYRSMGVLEAHGDVPSRSVYIFSQGMVLLHYLRLSIVPYGQILDAGWRPPTLAQGALPFAAICLFLLVGLWGLFRLRAWSLTIVLFFLILAPSSGLVPIVDLMFEHRMYLANLLVITLVVTWVHQAISRGLSSRAATNCGRAIVGAAVVFLMIATFWRNTIYYSEIAAYSDAVAKNAVSGRVFNNLGVGLMNAKKYDDAAAFFKKAIEVRPHMGDPYASLAQILLEQGKKDEAVALLTTALERSPRNDRCKSMLVAASNTSGSSKDIERERELLSLAANSPERSDVVLELATIEARLGKHSQALARLHKLIVGNSRDPKVYHLAGTILFQRGSPAMAADTFGVALKHYENLNSPEALDTRASLASALYSTGKTDVALAMLGELHQIRPNDLPTLTALARATAAKAPADAEVLYRRAVELAPNSVDMKFNLGVYLASRKRLDEAEQLFNEVLAAAPNHMGAKQVLNEVQQFRKKAAQ